MGLDLAVLVSLCEHHRVHRSAYQHHQDQCQSPEAAFLLRLQLQGIQVASGRLGGMIVKWNEAKLKECGWSEGMNAIRDAWKSGDYSAYLESTVAGARGLWKDCRDPEEVACCVCVCVCVCF